MKRKYIDAEKLTKAIEEKGLDCSFALKIERLDTLALIDELQQEQPELPSNLDEAANNYGLTARLGYPRVMDETDRYIYNAFKAGAEWMAGQGVNSEGKVFTSAFTSYVKTPGIEKLLKDAFPEDTEVIVQIRKK